MRCGSPSGSRVYVSGRQIRLPLLRVKKGLHQCATWVIFRRNESCLARALWPSWRSRMAAAKGVVLAVSTPADSKKIEDQQRELRQKAFGPSTNPANKVLACETLSEFRGIRLEVSILKRLTTAGPAEQMAEFPHALGLF